MYCVHCACVIYTLQRYAHTPCGSWVLPGRSVHDNLDRDVGYNIYIKTYYKGGIRVLGVLI